MQVVARAQPVGGQEDDDAASTASTLANDGCERVDESQRALPAAADVSKPAARSGVAFWGGRLRFLISICF